MKSLEQLINTDRPAIRQILTWADSADNPCEILPPSPDRERVLPAVGVSTCAVLGALAYETGGVLVDRGWLRFLGSGSPRFHRNLAVWNQSRRHGYYLVADDAVGGFFGLGRQRDVYYWAPDKLDWEPLGFRFTDFFRWSLSSALANFYQHLRWKAWSEDVEKLPADRCYSFTPFLWTEEGTVEGSERRSVSVNDAYDLKVDIVRKQSIQISNVDGVTVVCFKDLARVFEEGRFEQVEQQVWALVEQQQSTSIILDFESMEFPPCHVLQALLIRLHKRLNSGLKLCNLHTLVAAHFEIAGLADKLNIYPAREDALAATKL